MDLGKIFHRHIWVTIKESMGYTDFHGIAGDYIPNVRVKAVKERCAVCNKVRAYVIDGHNTHYPIEACKI
jgi:hypothetical protein